MFDAAILLHAGAADLHRLGRSKPAIATGLTALLGEDLARKLSNSVQARATA